MTRASPLTWIPLFERALDEEIGIAFTVDGIDRKYFISELYEARKQSKDPRLNGLIVFQPNNNEIWICKKEVEMDDAG